MGVRGLANLNERLRYSPAYKDSKFVR